jgi:ATP-dependent Clp protease ATP-binding subunit ClpB
MQFDKLTMRSQEALQDAQRLASDENQQEISPLYLMLAAMGQDVVIFRSLSEEDIARIVQIQVGLLVRRLEERKIAVRVTERARAQLARLGYDPTYGARPLKRAIQRSIQDPLALKVLEGEFQEGDTVEVDVDRKGEFTFLKKP